MGTDLPHYRSMDDERCRATIQRQSSSRGAVQHMMRRRDVHTQNASLHNRAAAAIPTHADERSLVDDADAAVRADDSAVQVREK